MFLLEYSKDIRSFRSFRQVQCLDLLDKVKASGGTSDCKIMRMEMRAQCQLAISIEKRSSQNIEFCTAGRDTLEALIVDGF